MKNSSFLESKTLLLINTGSIKKRFILQKLKKIGIQIIVVHKEKNWASPYVKDWILADTYNHTEVIQSIHHYLIHHKEIHFDGVITFWEDDVILQSKICEEFNLIGNSVETATNTRDKLVMQDIFQRTRQNAILQILLQKKEDLKIAIDTIGFPAVIKPVLGADSEFVVMVKDAEEAYEAYEYLVKNCTPRFNPIFITNKGQFLYQEYIEGPEFSVEAYSQFGVPHIVGIHEKTAMSLPFFMETGDYIPPRIDEKYIQAITKASEAALIVLGVKDGLSHIELKLTKSGIKIIEVASRMGGDYTYRTIKEAYGVDLIKTGIDIALGMPVFDVKKELSKYIQGKFFIPKQSGIITKLNGFTALKKEKKILDFQLHKKIGDSVLAPPDGFENIGWILIKGNSYTQLERKMEQIMNTLDIEVVPFKSSSAFGKTKRKNRFAPALLYRKKLRGAEKIEHIRAVSKNDLPHLHIGVACNIYEDTESAVEKDLMSVGKNIQKTLIKRGYQVTFFDFNCIEKSFRALQRSNVDMVFNVCERINGSSLLEPHAASLLDILQIPYTGSNSQTLALCIDKIRVKKLLSFHTIPTPKWDYVYDVSDPVRDDLHYPLIVKPANSDNSIGITNNSVVTNQKELKKQIEHTVLELSTPALIEEYIEGDEYDVSILGNEENDLQVLPLSRSIFTNMPKGYWHIYPYEAKWNADSAYKKIIIQRPANISKKLASLITEVALDTYNILHCHDYGRVEIRVDKNGNPFVLELNPNPSINIGDCVPNVAAITGMDYGDFLEEIIKLAIKRYKDRPPYYHLQTSII